MKSTFLSIVMACAAASLFAQNHAIFVRTSNGQISKIPVESVLKISMNQESMNVETTDGNKVFAIGHLINISTSDIDPRAINLGLSVDWAVSNMGTESPTALGDRYSWGETSPKTSFPIGGALYEQSFSSLQSMGAIDANGNLTPKYDAATVVLGEGWRMPTKEEISELNQLCTTEWTEIDGVKGQLFTGLNGATIFLPAHGQSFQGKEDGEGEYGMWWSASVDPTSPVTSHTLAAEWRRVNWGTNNRYVGLPIRPVKVKNVSSPIDPDNPDNPAGNVNPKVPLLYCPASSADAT